MDDKRYMQLFYIIFTLFTIGICLLILNNEIGGYLSITMFFAFILVATHKAMFGEF